MNKLRRAALMLRSAGAVLAGDCLNKLADYLNGDKDSVEDLEALITQLNDKTTLKELADAYTCCANNKFMIDAGLLEVTNLDENELAISAVLDAFDPFIPRTSYKSDSEPGITVWKLSVNQDYSFTERNYQAGIDYPTIVYDSNSNNVKYSDEMECKLFIGTNGLLYDPDEYSDYGISAPKYYYKSDGGETTYPNNDYVCITNSSFADVAGVIICKSNVEDINVETDVSIDTVYVSSVAVKVLVYEKDGVKYYNLATLTNEDNTAWVTEDDLPEGVELTNS